MCQSKMPIIYLQSLYRCHTTPQATITLNYTILTSYSEQTWPSSPKINSMSLSVHNCTLKLNKLHSILHQTTSFQSTGDNTTLYTTILNPYLCQFSSVVLGQMSHYTKGDYKILHYNLEHSTILCCPTLYYQYVGIHSKCGPGAKKLGALSFLSLY